MVVQAEPGITDGELFQLARQGDQAAFGQIVDRHKDALVNYLTRLSGSRERAEDLAHEAFLRLYQKGQDYRERGQLRAYLFRIATNLMRSEARREQRWRQLQPLFLVSSRRPPELPQQTRLLRRELAERLLWALRRLPLHYRAPLILSHIQGWTHREIASFLGCREGTVKSRLHRGCRMLRDQLEGYWEDASK